MDDEEITTTALEDALSKVLGDTAASIVVDAREATSFTVTEQQTWVLFLAVLIVALGGLLKNMRGGPVQILAETWRDEQAFKREWRKELERRKLEKETEDGRE